MTNNNQPIFTIENGVLTHCDLNGNTDIVLPDEVIAIGADVFSKCANLSSITCPNVKKIGHWAFSSCENLASILCQNVKNIGEWAFYGCENLSGIELPNMQVIGELAFGGCNRLEEIILSDNNPNYYFENGILYNKNQTEIIWCKKNMESYTAPLSVTKIDSSAFCGCERLTSIEMPNMQVIGELAFSGCNRLEEIILSDNNPNYYFENGILYNKNQTEIIWCKKNMESYTAPLSVVKIGKWAFSGCENLSSIELPNVQVIDSLAFKRCKSLTSIELPNVQQIGWKAFDECENLTTIVIPHDKIFKSYENFIASDRFTSDQKVVLSMSLLATKNDWDEEEKKKYQAYLSRGAKKLVCGMIDRENMEGLLRCEQAGLLTKRRIDGFVEYAVEQGKVAMTAYLMNYKHEHFPVK